MDERKKPENCVQWSRCNGVVQQPNSQRRGVRTLLHNKEQHGTEVSTEKHKVNDVHQVGRKTLPHGTHWPRDETQVEEGSNISAQEVVSDFFFE